MIKIHLSNGGSIIHEKDISTKDRTLALQQFTAANCTCTDLLLYLKSADKGGVVLGDILCLAALCTATLIRAVGPHCVNHLHNLL
jgi:hypothetical protein